MPIHERRSPYAYVTWLTKLLAGEDRCLFKSWYRAHFQDYPIIEETPERKAKLDAWIVEHDALVQATGKDLQREGYRVTYEDLNTFNYRGKTATLAGKPDLVGKKGLRTLIVDGKTGKPRESDRWQVKIYLYAWTVLLKDERGLPLAEPRDATGVIVRPEGMEATPAVDLTAEDRTKIVALIRDVGGELEPPRTPSEKECSWCALADCPDRAARPGVAHEAEGDAF